MQHPQALCANTLNRKTTFHTLRTTLQAGNLQIIFVLFLLPLNYITILLFNY